MDTLTYTTDRFDVRRLAASAAIDDDLLANAQLHDRYDDFARRTVLDLQAKVLAGPEETIRLEAYFEAHTVDSVWAAVCYYWLQPLFRFFYEWLHWQWLYEASLWASNHVTLVTEEQNRTEHVVTRMCPHIKVQGNQQHLEFLRDEQPLEFNSKQKVQFHNGGLA